jgi:hypothetical protein
VDDLINGGATHEACATAGESLMAAMASANFKFGAGKMELGSDDMRALGFRCRAGHLEPDPDRVQAISKLTPPVNRSQLWGFLGLTGYYRMFVKSYAARASPLTMLLKETVPWQ